MADIEQRVEKLEGEFHNLRTDIKDLSKGFNSLSKHVSTIENNQSIMTSHLSSIDQSMKELKDINMNQVALQGEILHSKVKAEKLEDRVDNIERKGTPVCAVHNQEVKAIKEQCDIRCTNFDKDMKALMDRQDESCAVVQNEITEIKAELDRHEGSFSKIYKLIDEKNTRMLWWIIGVSGTGFTIVTGVLLKIAFG